MKLLLLELRERVQTSIWIIPALLCVACVMLALLLLWVDRDLMRLLSEDNLLRISPASARHVLGVIAGAVLSVGGVVFSVTMVALTLTSGQYGPKIIRRFLGDHDSKITLGLFMGTSLYCLVTIAGFRDADTPGTTVVAALVLTIAALAGFIRFIHHTATDLQADQIIERICGDLQKLLRRLVGKEHYRDRVGDTLAWRRRARGTRPLEIGADTTGYVQAVDYPMLVRWCAQQDCVCHLRIRAGDFLLRGRCFVKLYGCDREPGEERLHLLRRCFSTGPIRTPVQDPEYPITQLHQLAARALSPGINDPGTAVTCLDWYTMAVAEIVDRDLPGRVFLDPDHQPRVLARITDFSSMLNAFFAPLRQFARQDAQVLAAIYDSLTGLAELTSMPGRLQQLAGHGQALWKVIPRDYFLDEDLRGIRQRREKLLTLTGRLEAAGPGDISP